MSQGVSKGETGKLEQGSYLTWLFSKTSWENAYIQELGGALHILIGWLQIVGMFLSHAYKYGIHCSTSKLRIYCYFLANPRAEQFFENSKMIQY